MLGQLTGFIITDVKKVINKWVFFLFHRAPKFEPHSLSQISAMLPVFESDTIGIAQPHTKSDFVEC